MHSIKGLCLSMTIVPAFSFPQPSSLRQRVLAPLLPGCVTLNKLLSLSEHQVSICKMGKGLKKLHHVRVEYNCVCEGLGLPPEANAFGEWARPNGMGAAEAGGQELEGRGPHHPARVRTQDW